MKYLLLFVCTLFISALSGQEIDSIPQDSIAKINHGRIPFIDSLRNDSLSQYLEAPFLMKVPTSKVGRIIDPFDPFNKENFLRHGLGKFWFFIVSMLIVGLMLYFRSAFPNQLVLRVRSLFNGYYFRELISEFGISFTSGSVVAGIISTLVLAQAVVVVVVYSGYVNLNSIIFYLLVVLVVVIWKVMLLFVQRLQAYVLDLSEVSRNQTQRQINIDFGVSMLIFPFVTLAYFNASRLAGVDVALIMVVMITVWFTLRVILEFIGLFRESGLSFSGILYFCGFEIIPHAVLLTALFRMYTA
ncbi:MAG: DUF4271 domain-containing protein [Bacteroidetes bacterium]|nr:DUF4271 domain-containing protein [Bacteroidota bacterium]